MIKYYILWGKPVEENQPRMWLMRQNIKDNITHIKPIIGMKFQGALNKAIDPQKVILVFEGMVEDDLNTPSIIPFNINDYEEIYIPNKEAHNIIFWEDEVEIPMDSLKVNESSNLNHIGWKSVMLRGLTNG